MMGIVVDDGNAIHLALVFKSPVSSSKFLKPLFHLIKGYSKKVGDGDGSQCVGYIVVAIDGQRYPINEDASFYQVKRSLP